MKMADVEDDWPDKDIIDRMRFPIKRNFITLSQEPADFDADLVKILESAEADESVQVTQFPDDLLMAAKSPRATASPPFVGDTRPSYIGAVLEPGPVQVLETSRVDIAPSIEKSAFEKIEEAWRQNSDSVSFTTIWPKTETSRLAAAIIFQELLDLWKRKEIVLSQTCEDPDDIFIEKPH